MKMTKAILLGAAVAQIAPAQTFTSLANFDGPNGANPTYMALIQGPDGAVYGTTTKGGRYGHGTVFKITPAGISTIYSFDTAVGSSRSARCCWHPAAISTGTTETDEQFAPPARARRVGDFRLQRL